MQIHSHIQDTDFIWKNKGSSMALNVDKFQAISVHVSSVFSGT